MSTDDNKTFCDRIEKNWKFFLTIENPSEEVCIAAVNQNVKLIKLKIQHQTLILLLLTKILISYYHFVE
jgi:hypothetical protein